jgi:uncharacterized protein
MNKIKITVGKKSAEGVLYDTQTAKKVLDALPISTEVNTWGDEIYFAIPVEEELDNTAKELVELGDIGYWPSGNAFCIFYGKTPISQANEIRPASAVNMIGKIQGDPLVFKGVKDGEKILLEKFEK